MMLSWLTIFFFSGWLPGYGQNPCDQLTITESPNNFPRNERGQITGCAGSNITLTANYPGPGVPVSYLWTVDGATVSSAPSFSLIFPTVPPLRRSVTVRITLPGGITCSRSVELRSVLRINSATLNVDPRYSLNFCNDGRNQDALLVVQTQPVNAEISTYAWYRNGERIERATGNTYFAAESGNYTVRVSNPCGGVTTTSVTVNETVVPGVSIISNNACGSRGIRAVVSNTPACSVSYTWFRNGVQIVNDNADPAELIPTQSGNYTVQIACGNCTQTSQPFRFQVGNAQQSRLWSLPLSNNAANSVSFDGANANTLTTPALPINNSPGGYQGQPYQYCHNAWYTEDSRGVKRLSLFVVDGNVYDGTGQRISQLTQTGADIALAPEVGIVPIPGNCNDYLVIWLFASCFQEKPASASATWHRIKNGVKVNENFLEAPSTVGFNCGTINIAVSQERMLPWGGFNGRPVSRIPSRLVYIRYCNLLVCYRVSDFFGPQNVIHPYQGQIDREDNPPSNLNSYNTIGLPSCFGQGNEGVVRSEMELSIDNTNIIVASSDRCDHNNYLKVTIKNVNTLDRFEYSFNGVFTATQENINTVNINANTRFQRVGYAGIEITDDGQYFYATCREFDVLNNRWDEALYQVSTQTPYTATPVNLVRAGITAQDRAIIARSFIEKGPNGRFFVRADNSLLSFAHDPNVANINFTRHVTGVGNTTPQCGAADVANETNTDRENLIYALTDQIDGECYPNYTAFGQGTLCCLGDREWRGGNNVINTGVNVNNQTVYIDRLTIQNGGRLSLFGCTVLMGEGGSIIVENGGTLDLEACNITVCGNMWRGIVASGSDAVVKIVGTFTNTRSNTYYIEGALAAVTVSNGADLLVRDMILKDNIYGIRIANYPENNPFSLRSVNNPNAPTNNEITQSTFQNPRTFRYPMVRPEVIRNFMQPGFGPALATYQTGNFQTWNQTEAHVLIENAFGVTVGPDVRTAVTENRFENGRAGIFVSDRVREVNRPSVTKQCTVRNNRFENQINASIAMRTQYTQNLPDNGDDLNFYDVRVESNNIVGSTNIVNNLAGINDYGVDATGIGHVVVRSNRINACRLAGVRKLNGGSAVDGSNVSENLTIDFNSFRNQQQACIVVDQSRRTVITVNNNNTVANETTDSPLAIAVAVINTDIQNRSTFTANFNRWIDVADGFLINNISAPQIINNTIQVSGGANPLQAGSNYFFPFGICTNNSRNVNILSNTLRYNDTFTNLTGIAVLNPGSGQASGTSNIECNDITTFFNGIDLLGDQRQTFSLCNYLRANGVGLYYTGATNVPPHVNDPTRAQDNRWFDVTVVPGRAHTFCDRFTDGTLIPFFRPTSGNAIYNPTINGGLRPIVPRLIPAAPQCSGCQGEGLGINPGDGAYDNLHLFLSPNGTTFDYISSWDQLYATFKLLDIDTAFRVSRPAYVSFYNATFNTPMGLLGRAENMITKYGKCHCNATSGCLNSVVPGNFLEANLKDYLTAYNGLVANPDTVLDTLLTDRLQSLANQSITDGGYSVIAARNVMNTYNRQPIYYGTEYSEPVLTPMLPKKEVLTENAAIRLYPNPNQGDFTVECELKEGEKGSLEIRNLLGQTIAETPLVFNSTGFHSVSLPGLASGSYVYRVRVNGEIKAVSKLVITD